MLDSLWTGRYWGISVIAVSFLHIFGHLRLTGPGTDVDPFQLE